MNKYLIGLFTGLFVTSTWCHEAHKVKVYKHHNGDKQKLKVIDLTHVIPTFLPLDNDPTMQQILTNLAEPLIVTNTNVRWLSAPLNTCVARVPPHVC